MGALKRYFLEINQNIIINKLIYTKKAQIYFIIIIIFFEFLNIFLNVFTYNEII